MEECCKNCSKYKQLETWTYSSDGVEHKTAAGFACLTLIDEGLVVNMVGVNEDEGVCEEFNATVS